MASLVTKKGLIAAAKDIGKAMALAGVATLHPGAGIALATNYVVEEVEANIKMAEQEKEIEEKIAQLESKVERRRV